MAAGHGSTDLAQVWFKLGARGQRLVKILHLGLTSAPFGVKCLLALCPVSDVLCPVSLGGPCRR